MFSERMNNKGNQHQQGNNDNAWGGQQVRKSFDNYYNNNRGDYQHHEGGRNLEQRMSNMRLDGHSYNKASSGAGSSGAGAEHKESSGPKKMTWATIASQPAKPQINTTSTTIKKKGPGMPPPPMIPGKHNMELTDGWDTPKNGPLVPPSPPVIPPPQPDQQSSLDKQNNSMDGQPAWPTPGQAQIQTQNQAQSGNAGNQQTSQSHHQQQQQQQQQNHHPNQYHQNSRSGGASGGGYHSMNNNNNQNPNNYNSGGRQYNQNQNSGAHHHYNDYQKPYHQHPHQMPSAPPQQQQQQQVHQSNQQQQQQPPPTVAAPIARVMPPPAHEYSSSPTEETILDQLRVKNQYNPSELDLSLVDNARFFVIKSYSEDDIHRSIKYEIWCSTEHGNKRLDQAFRAQEKENGVIYLFFSVNSSGHFCGVAQMITPVDYNSNSSVWSQDKWKGSFRVKWIYVKDVPNTQLRHIRLENNENKPVTNSRDTQEVPNGHGIQIMKIVHSFKHTTSIFDDFTHYEKRQEEEDSRKHESNDSFHKPMTLPPSHHSTHNRENMNRQQQYDNRSFDRDSGYNNGSSGGFERGGGFNKPFNGRGGYNNDFKPFNGRGGFNKRNDFRNDRNGDQQSGGFYRASKDFEGRNDDFGGNRGGFRSDRGDRGGRGRGSFRPMNHNN